MKRQRVRGVGTGEQTHFYVDHHVLTHLKIGCGWLRVEDRPLSIDAEEPELGGLVGVRNVETHHYGGVWRISYRSVWVGLLARRPRLPVHEHAFTQGRVTRVAIYHFPDAEVWVNFSGCHSRYATVAEDGRQATVTAATRLPEHRAPS